MIIYPRRIPNAPDQATSPFQKAQRTESLVSVSLVLTLALVALTLAGDVVTAPKAAVTHLARN